MAEDARDLIEQVIGLSLTQLRRAGHWPTARRFRGDSCSFYGHERGNDRLWAAADGADEERKHGLVHHCVSPP